MSATTILQLRQSESTDVTNNGNWKSTLDYPIQIDEGDEVVIKSVFLDTTVEDSGIIAINDNLDISMTCMMYLQNFSTDQKYNFISEPAGLAQFRQYGPTAIAADAPVDSGDNNLWWLAQTYQSTNEILWDVESISWRPTHPINSTHRVHQLDIDFKYVGVIPNQPDVQGSVYIPPMRASHYQDHNPLAVGKICKGDESGPFFYIETDTDYMFSKNVDPTSIVINAVKQVSSGNYQVVPQTFDIKFQLSAGNYTPVELAKNITDQINNVQKSGPVYFETDPATSHYPVDTPLLTTVLQNFYKITEEGTAASPTYVTNQIFVSSTLGEYNPKIDGKAYFNYPFTKMVDEKNDNPYRPILDRFVGTNQIALEFDEGENKLKWTIQHFPIYNNLTDIATANDALPAVAFNLLQLTGNYKGTTGLATRYSGIAWTALTAQDSKTKKKSNFWNDIGLAGSTVTPLTTGIKMNYGDVVPSADNSFTVVATDGVNITGGYPGLDIPVVKNNLLYTAPVHPVILPAGGNERTDYVGTTDTTSIFANRVFNSAPETEGYYLIEIGTNFKQAFLGGNATYMSGVQSIVNRYYTQNSYTSDQGAGSISYFHKGESQTLTEFNIRVLNPNFTVPPETQLGISNTIFIEVVKQKLTPTK